MSAAGWFSSWRHEARVKWLWWCLLVLAPACASPLAALKDSRALEGSGGNFVLRYSEVDADNQQQVAHAITDALPAVTRWGPLREPVKVYLLPSHADLETVVGRYGYDWLKAWARYDEIYLQSPHSWGPQRVPDHEVIELLKHELTHCAMYQRIGTRESWAQKEVPLWFREGMATWTAGQAYRWPSLEELAHYLNEGRGDPFRAPDALYQRDSDIVYAAAHHAFTFLAARYGVPSIEALLDAMHAGANFNGAFEKAIGIPARDFIGEFSRFVRWRAFRGSGRMLKPLSK